VKIATTVVRILLGLLFLFASITYFFGLITPPPMTGAIKTFNDGLDASVYLMPVVKAVELLCGALFVAGRFVPLATVLIAPIIVNIVLVHAFMAPEGLPIALFAALANAFVAWQHRESYKPLLKA
jgi:putative oxidoreductase